MKERVKVGIAGLGNHAIQPHLAKLLKMSEVEIVGAFDPDISRFDKVNEMLGTKLKFFNSYQELCFASDAVVICSPDDVHFSQLMIAAEEYGCHVLVEKPILTDKSQVKAFKELLKKTNKVITTCHPRRFDAMFVRIKELVAEYRKKYGKVKYFEIRTESAVPTENERRNYHDSLLSDHLCHELDLMNYILGSEKVKTVERHWDGFDDYGFMGERADEARFFFRATKNLEKGAPCHIKMRIMFNMAELYVDNLGETYLSVHVRCYSNYYVTVKQLHAYRKKVKLPDSDHNAKYEALNRNFIDSILGKAEPYLSKDEILMAATLPLRYMRQRK